MTQASENQPILPNNIDPQMHALVSAAIKDKVLARTLTEEQVSQVAIEAILENKVSDEMWLQQAIRRTEESSPHIPGSKIPKIPISQRQTITCQEDFDRIVENHAKWIANILHPTKANEGGRANLSGSDLSGLVFDGVDLRGANMANCKIEGAALIGSNFATCNFSGTAFKNCSFDKVSLRRAKLDKVTFESCRLSQVDLRRASWESSTWNEVAAEQLLLDPNRKIKGVFPQQEASSTAEEKES